MFMYAINIVTTTKNKDLYERVAVNEYPIIVKCMDKDRLNDILASDKFTSIIKDELKTPTLYKNGIYFIRDQDGKSFTLSVPETTKVEY